MLVPCIAVIDEDDGGYCTHVKWAEFRDTYPDRPFCLLIPFDEYWGEWDEIGIPQNVLDDPLFQVHNVSRDEGNTTADEWFEICGLGDLGSSNVPYVGLFVDGSGSMHKGTVENSYNKFLEDVSAAGLTICEVHNGSEEWIEPFLSTLTSNNGGQCTEPKPYKETSYPTYSPTITPKPTSSPRPTWDYTPWPTWPPTISRQPSTPWPTLPPTITGKPTTPLPTWGTSSPHPTSCASPVWDSSSSWPTSSFPTVSSSPTASP